MRVNHFDSISYAEFEVSTLCSSLFLLVSIGLKISMKLK